jgi:hypothetical protein
MKRNLYIIVGMSLWLFATALHAQNIIEDEGVGLDREELTKIVENWRPEMRKSAANDLGDRLELLNMALTNKKMAMRAEQMSPASDPQAYWRYHFWLQRMQRKFVFDRFMAQLQVPDMSALAEERYVTEKDKYAKVPEQRRSSHILFMCPPGCDRTPIKPQAAELLVQLRAGADFEEMVVVHSQDPGTKKKKGKMNRWIEYGQVGITPNYSGGLFEIEDVGGYSEVVETEFGLHIIRLDEVRESYYLPFAEARESIVQTLEGEYRELAAKEFEANFRVTDDVRIDGPAMEEIFGPYKTVKE